MKTHLKLAIYLDHSEAKLFEFNGQTIPFKSIKSNFDNQDKKEILQKGESHLHHKEQQLQHKYYENLGREIQHFTTVLLFGATEAKTELFNYLRKNKHFSNIEIDVKNSDKLTENQQLAFVNKHYLL